MSLKIKKRINWLSVLLILFLFSIIYQSGTVQASINPDDPLFNFSRILMLIIPLLCLVINKGIKKSIAVKMFLLIIVMEGLAVINFILFPYSAGTLQYKIILFLLFFMMAFIVEQQNKDIEMTMYNIIICIAIITLFFYIIIEIIGFSLPYNIFQKEGSFRYRSYFNIYYSYSRSTIPRLSGLFWEPGVYQIYLNMALFFYYKHNMRNKFHLILLLMNLLLAQSTSGYMLATLIMIGIIIDRKKANINTRRVIEIIGVIIALVCILTVFVNKKNATNTAGDSYYDRLLQAKVGLQLFCEKPLFGCGFYNTIKYGEYIQTGSGNSNGLITWMYTTGIVGLSLALIPFVINLNKGKNHKERLVGWIWLIFVVVENMTEPIYALSIMVLIESNEYYMMLKEKRIENVRLINNWMCMFE